MIWTASTEKDRAKKISAGASLAVAGATQVDDAYVLERRQDAISREP